MNRADCPNCETTIDATQAALDRMCPECNVSFARLVNMATDEYEPPEIEYPIDAPGGTQ